MYGLPNFTRHLGDSLNGRKSNYVTTKTDREHARRRRHRKRTAGILSLYVPLGKPVFFSLAREIKLLLVFFRLNEFSAVALRASVIGDGKREVGTAIYGRRFHSLPSFLKAESKHSKNELRIRFMGGECTFDGGL